MRYSNLNTKTSPMCQAYLSEVCVKSHTHEKRAHGQREREGQKLVRLGDRFSIMIGFFDGRQQKATLKSSVLEPERRSVVVSGVNPFDLFCASSCACVCSGREQVFTKCMYVNKSLHTCLPVLTHVGGAVPVRKSLGTFRASTERYYFMKYEKTVTQTDFVPIPVSSSARVKASKYLLISRGSRIAVLFLENLISSL
jgi:hypothetical protein